MKPKLTLIKNQIMSEFISMIVRKDGNVHVTDLAKQCGISRRTFYYHFDNTQDLV